MVAAAGYTEDGNSFYQRGIVDVQCGGVTVRAYIYHQQLHTKHVGNDYSDDEHPEDTLLHFPSAQWLDGPGTVSMGMGGTGRTPLFSYGSNGIKQLSLRVANPGLKSEPASLPGYAYIRPTQHPQIQSVARGAYCAHTREPACLLCHAHWRLSSRVSSPCAVG